MNKTELKERCRVWQHHYFKGQKWWSFAHHVSLFGSIICSIAAGAFIQASSEYKVVASTLTAVAAALTGMAAAGGFSRKWRSNRISRSRVDGILIDLENEGSDVLALSDELKSIIVAHDQEVVTSDESRGRAGKSTG